jgi:hypothetical protein
VRQSRLTVILTFALVRSHAATPPAEIPFEYREGLLWIKAAVTQSATPLNVLLDTGAGVSVLDAAAAERLKLRFGRLVNVRGVESTVTGHWLNPISATASGVQLPAHYLAVDLHQLGKSCQRPVDGILGADFFCGRIVQIDFDARKLRILADTPEHRNADTIPLEVRPCGMRLPITVNGRKLQWVRLDTGCVSALQWVTSAVRPQDCSRQPAVGLTELSVPQTQTTVRLGSQEFHNVPTGLHEKPIFHGEAGLLGNALLSRFSSITIDAKSGHLVLDLRTTAGP